MTDAGDARHGPLCGLRILEMDAVGPVPFCATLLASLGADVLHVARPQSAEALRTGVRRRGCRSVQADLKSPGGLALVRRLAARADILLEGSRPGAMERLGLGPADLRPENPRLVYGRMTGWGQTGPLATTAGHDINYIALSGVLHAIGRAGERPVPPLNLVGDYGGGAMFLAVGVLAAAFEARSSGRGQVVDAAMVDGSAALMTLFCGLAAQGSWTEERGTNLLDGGAPWYDTYETADGGFVAVGAIEEPFWRALLDGLGLAPSDLPPRVDRAGWPVIRERLAALFRSRTRDAWEAVFARTDACVTPVLPLSEARRHPHLVARATFTELGGVSLPAAAPRFERPEPAVGLPVVVEPDEALVAWESCPQPVPAGRVASVGAAR